ncbi:hypothetical protein M406DRAFT_33731 [Cryphonectria parasitica EP155]|uniref:Carrier domain-containing protein n=1 Tax=Cryphonectria parasitica (strain ATCC 38755 / EP155) TaxID=660469 RepID=A0A9P5CW04_CRYP1|nr:uncharacterized protein M406DRAFT_33731 [Cryphonectria parasitica EP155]KAF3771381.1 hypothetical protein M406DRAFT_33731 [Cryphonectria parasitica EP155]
MLGVVQPDLEELLQRLNSRQLSPEEAWEALRLLSTSLQQSQDSWRTLDLIRCHSRLGALHRGLGPSGSSEESKALLQDTACHIKQTYRSLADFIPHKPGAALYRSDTAKYISHQYLQEFVEQFALPIESQEKSKPVVSIALPNGPLLAAVCVAVTAHYVAAPINPAAGAEQFQADVLQAGARCILTTQEGYSKLDMGSGWIQANNIVVLLVDLTEDMRITISTLAGAPASVEAPAPPNTADDIALVLFTSGTSGKKKVVPITTHSIIAGVAFVIESWQLTPEDVCLNMMPLYHIGGLVRNIFAPIFSSGSTICCSVFDPSSFWDIVDTSLPTWYYASPSMHSLILAESTVRSRALENSRIRLVCNAAGGLLPSLAIQLRDTFDAVVLPSYGMTECMPISTPPVDYRLSRPGTSGVSTGPELAILNDQFKAVLSNTVGRICVRGEPLFSGYLQPDGSIDRSAFTDDGWFDTGDLGYMDSDGYLYITGRNKEVINRGGELISPMEVENAIIAAALKPSSPLHERVTQALAFSVQHDVLQEVVGVALVTPSGVPRPDLRLLHSSLKTSLQQVKWPALIVYMSDLPKKNNKILRIKLAERLSLPQLTDQTIYIARHWEADCPPPDQEVSVPILCKTCKINVNALWKEFSCILPHDCSFCIRMSPKDRTVGVIIAPTDPDRLQLDETFAAHVKSKLETSLPGYMMPTRIQTLQVALPVDIHGKLDDRALRRYLAQVEASSSGENGSSVERRVAKAFSSVLNLNTADIGANANFFDLGGDSLRAGRLLSLLRAEFNSHITIDVIFQHGSVRELADYIGKKISDGECSKAQQSDESFVAQGCEETHSSTRWSLMALQLLPMFVFYPVRRAYQWTIFMVFLAYTQTWVTTNYVPGRLLNLSISILVARLVTKAVIPWVGIAAKWLIIGRYKEGLYPMWGSYHTRWWMVQKIVDICGHGLFAQTNYTSCLYLRLMGARIGKNVSIRGVSTGEWDLIEIDDDAVLERCTVRPFAGERNTTMYLGRIRIGRNATVGIASIVAPSTTVPEGTCIGANSSSHELDAADEANRDLMLSSIPSTHWSLDWLVTKPLATIGWMISLIPWLLGLSGLIITEPISFQTPMYSILQWFAGSRRVGFHYLALVLRASLSPFVLFGYMLVLKWALDALFGTQQPTSARGRSHFEKWRMSLVKTIYPAKRLHEMTELLGQHYEGTSIAIRLLGGRVGKRVYWPGTGPSIGDYHLLDIGNDVVFGSRAHLVTSDGTGSDIIKVQDRAMIADRVVLLPGVHIGEKATMGSGALTRRNKSYTGGGIYVGSKNGDAVCLSTGSSPESDDFEDKLTPDDASPFGRAFYLKQAPFRVYGLPTIIMYSSIITVFAAFYWNVPSISAIQIIAFIFRKKHEHIGNGDWYDIPVLYSLFFGLISVITTVQAVLAIAITIGAKWYLLGRRQPGNYDWDKSPYCQNWQLYLTIEKLRRYCFRGYGILGMLTGTHWLVLYFRALGAEIGDNCALFANGRPSLMFTEPDLITIGDRTVIDDASVVGHINTRGKFDLNRLSIGQRCVLRSGSRLLSGAQMKDDSVLLEHTLVMSGDVVEKGWTMQGWPADRFKGRSVNLADGKQPQQESRKNLSRSNSATSNGTDTSCRGGG